ncbi:hypothetical protein [Gordonia sp. N1V]|uniref:hypothetical protein n=1 Tax=Gordonia sp. N1V TaxID=3034163 RepID=UPI0023E0F030|nr:hypothetical protein [Gordonia sp. N1V]MDF3280856.1 hypothetical protein [Gordonia sp. N1V]
MSDNTIRPFADFLRELQKGEIHQELSEQLHALIGRVAEVGKAGSLTLTLKVKRDRSGMIQIDDDVKAKLPQWERPSSMWFVDKNGNPTKRDPQQLEFKGIEVVKPETTDNSQEAVNE